MQEFWQTWIDELKFGDLQGFGVLDTLADLRYPFHDGQWYVFQGYDTGTHTGVYGSTFDLVRVSCCNLDTNSSVIAAAGGSFYKYYISSALGWGVKIVLADGSVVENDHLSSVPGIWAMEQPLAGATTSETSSWGIPEALTTFTSNFLVNNQPVTLEYGYWHYPDGGQSSNCGCGAHGEWSGTKVGCCGCLPAACCSTRRWRVIQRAIQSQV